MAALPANALVELNSKYSKKPCKIPSELSQLAPYLIKQKVETHNLRQHLSAQSCSKIRKQR